MEAIGRLAGGVAHDFNNILTIISGYTELLESEVEPTPSAQKKLKAILTAANRGAALTGQLLAFSKKQVLQTAVLNLNSTVQQVADMVDRVVGEDVEVKVITHPKLGMTQVDGGQMKQVILNLVVNARDAMPNGGRLILETANVELGEDYAKSHLEAHPGEYVMLSVSDSGCGMDAETCSHIFEPFFTTKPRGKGTGLGLSTAYGIVKQSGGNITVYSEVGRGTTFKIYFPVVRAAGEVIPSPAMPSSANIRGRGELILVIEDDKILSSVITEYLSAGGYRVLSASNHDEAIQLAQSNRDDLVFVLTDMILFGKSGYHIAEAIKKEVRGVKVVYMSGYPSDAIVTDGVLAKESHFLQKPFTRMALLQLIHELLRGNETSVPPDSAPQWRQMAGDYKGHWKSPL
jgi:CheY-like chemotaxis protein